MPGEAVDGSREIKRKRTVDVKTHGELFSLEPEKWKMERWQVRPCLLRFGLACFGEVKHCTAQGLLGPRLRSAASGPEAHGKME